MKKTLVAALISSVILLTGCQDKDSEAKIKQLNQTVAQLSAENTKLKEQIENGTYKVDSKKLAKASERITANKVAEEDVISSVMIKTKSGVDSVKLAKEIEYEM